MKKQLPILLLALFCFSIQTTNAQQSCNFVIHVDGSSGIDQVGCGTETSPCASISFGLGRANISGDTMLRIKAGNYIESITLIAGISLWGGFDSEWKPTGVTSIKGGLAGNGQYYTLLADGIVKRTLISDLNILAPDALTEGKSSYGAHIANSTGLQFQRVNFTGGKAADGAPGKDGVDAQDTGVAGLKGGTSAQFSTYCNNNTSGAGGLGALTSGHSSTAGGNGGRGGFMDSDCSGVPPKNTLASKGIGGANANIFAPGSYGYAGIGGGLCYAGFNGQNGQTIHGVGGAGAVESATVVGSFWAATYGQNGTLGSHGSGGGGGGGSGGCDDGTDSYGAGGGGGGSGGLASVDSGFGGLSGGNSVAVFIMSSTCTFVNCSITLGQGGNGGNGGKSGLGAKGGKGGSGGPGIGTGAGGSGGNGGAGGNSGAGGGGAGGRAYGIYCSNAVVNRSNTTFAGGVSGISGKGGSGTPSGLEGGNGSAGAIVNIGGTVTDNQTSLNETQDPCSKAMPTNVFAKHNVHIYPNPFNEVLVIESAIENTHMLLYDVLGKVQLTGNIINGKGQLNTEKLPAGLYVLKIENQVVKVWRE